MPLNSLIELREEAVSSNPTDTQLTVYYDIQPGSGPHLIRTHCLAGEWTSLAYLCTELAETANTFKCYVFSDIL